MRLPFLRSKAAASPARSERSRAAAAADESMLVEAARTRARRRLIGALVLLVIGVVGFPIVFDTQPRPLPVDTPMVVPSVTTARREPAAASSRPAPMRSAAPAAVEAPTEAPIEVAAEPVASSPSGRAVSAVQPVAIGEGAEQPASAAAASAPVPVSAAASQPAGGRFVVQVGAYTDAATLRDARAKVEKMGLKTYTQVVASEAGPRTRVRLGPFATRDEADAAAARLKRAGLPANILAL